MTGAQYILDFLSRHHCDKAFGYPGGAIMPLYDALLDYDISHYLARHEQGAGFAAIGYARSTNRPGICFGTSGPGLTNLITPMADALLDSVPLLVISGQVASTSMGSDAFQEVDALGLSLSVTKHSFQVMSVESLPGVMAEAFQLCQEGRPGPVLVDVPKDILLTELPLSALNNKSPRTGSVAARPTDNKPVSKNINRANDYLQSSKRPLIYLGGGIAMADAIEPAREYIRRSGLPVISSLKGLGTAPENYPLDLGMLGMHGLREANLAVSHCDLLLVLGARLDDRATGKLNAFAPEACVIHVDIDAAELGKRRVPDVAIEDNISEVIEQLFFDFEVPEWIEQIARIRAEKPVKETPVSSAIQPEALLKRLSTLSGKNTIYTCDVGQHQMWAAQYLTFSSPRHHLTSGGLGTMGFGLPAAIGAQVANPKATVINICGDGSFMMNVQEMATLNRYKLPVKLIILDNQRLGMVKQWQELFHENRFSETDLSDNPPFANVATSFGLEAQELATADEIDQKLDWLLNCKGPCLLHVKLNPAENVWPIVPPNKGNTEMMEQSDA